jgi:hypothetical protein
MNRLILESLMLAGSKPIQKADKTEKTETTKKNGNKTEKTQEIYDTAPPKRKPRK